MKWAIKALTFQILSKTPGGDTIHHALQGLTGSTVPTEARTLNKVEQTLRYWRWLTANTSPEWLAEATHLELGSGWLPKVPITFYALGVQRQYLVDIRRHMKPDGVRRAIELFRAVAPRTEVPFARLPEVPAPSQSVEAMLDRLGMSYAAPYEDFPDQIEGTVGFVTASHMLLHLNRETLVNVFRSMHRLLKPGGCLLALQHLRQLFDGLESRTSPFFALRYSEEFWERFVNSDIMSFNRLKTRDYKQALEEAGFNVLLLEEDPGTAEDMKLLERARIHSFFSHYSKAELAARHLFMVAQKPCPATVLTARADDGVRAQIRGWERASAIFEPERATP